MQRSSFETCFQDNIVGLNGRMINFWIESREAVANGTRSNGDIEAFIERQFTRHGYSLDAAQTLICFLKENS